MRLVYQKIQEIVNSPSPQQMICEDDENNSEPEMVTHEDVKPEVVTSPKPERVSPKLEVAAPKADNLSNDLSKVSLTEKNDVAKRNDAVAAVGVTAAAVVAGATVSVAAAAVVTSPKRSASPNVADDDDRPKPPDDDSVPDEDSLVSFL